MHWRHPQSSVNQYLQLIPSNCTQPTCAHFMDSLVDQHSINCLINIWSRVNYGNFQSMHTGWSTYTQPTFECPLRCQLRVLVENINKHSTVDVTVVHMNQFLLGYYFLYYCISRKAASVLAKYPIRITSGDEARRLVRCKSVLCLFSELQFWTFLIESVAKVHTPQLFTGM